MSANVPFPKAGAICRTSYQAYAEHSVTPPLTGLQCQRPWATSSPLDPPGINPADLFPVSWWQSTLAVFGSPDAGSQMTAAPVSRRQTILLVDDEAIVRSLATRVLEEHGYSVVEADNGLDAWILLESEGEPIDLVISDVVMPRLDGFELARCMELMRHPPPILLMSGYGLSALQFEGPLLAKPFHAHELLVAVRRLLAPQA